MAPSWVHRVAPAFVALSLAIAFLPRLVLCVGPGGHHAIEPLNGACCRNIPPSTATVPGQGANGGCPQQCSDTPLGSGPVLIANDRAHRCNAVLAVLPPPVVTAQLMRWSTAGFITRRFAPAEHPPRVLRTTINLC